MIDNSKQLMPERYPEGDLFLCDVSDAVIKDIMPNMEHPFYSLSKKPETKIRRYEHNGNWLEVTPSVKGLATIYDKDILIYAISQIMAKIKRGEEPKKEVRINSYDLLQFTNRGTAGANYKALVNAISRLRGTVITTNVRSGGEQDTKGFGLIESFHIKRRDDKIDGRMVFCDITLSDWVFNAIKAKEVLTLHRDYFRLRKPIERRVYELARKHCGQQKKWPVKLSTLHFKSGSQGSLKLFKQAIKSIVKHNHLPDYETFLNEETNMIEFVNRGQWWEDNTNNPERTLPALKTTVYEKAKEAAPGFDVYQLEEEYREWFYNSKKPHPYDLEAAFVGFCKNKQAGKEQPKLL